MLLVEIDIDKGYNDQFAFVSLSSRLRQYFWHFFPVFTLRMNDLAP